MNNKITNKDYGRFGQFGVTTIIRRFGSWNKALLKAGIKIDKEHNISCSRLFDNLKEVWIKLGKQPTYQEMVKPISKFSVGAYLSKFKTWNKTLIAFSKYIENENPEPDEKPITRKEEKKQRIRNVNLRTRFIVMKRDNFTCKKCGNSPAKDNSVTLHVDHIKAFSKGGSDTIDNLQTLCSRCNIGKSNL